MVCISLSLCLFHNSSFPNIKLRKLSAMRQFKSAGRVEFGWVTMKSWIRDETRTAFFGSPPVPNVVTAARPRVLRPQGGATSRG